MKMKLFGNLQFAALTKELKILLISSFCITLGSFMIIPFISIYLSKTIDIKIQYVGLIIGIASLVQFSGGFIGGIIANYIGLKKCMILALSIRTCVFFILVISIFLPLVSIVGILFIASGSALYLPANKSYIIHLVDYSRKAFFLSISNATFNLGMTLGPLIGAILFVQRAILLFSLVTCFFLIITCIHIIYLKEINEKNNISYPNFNKNITFKQGIFPVLLITLTYYFYFFYQNYLGPFITSFLKENIYSYFLALNTILVCLFQPMCSKIINKINYLKLALWSFVIMALGMYEISLKEIFNIVLGVICISFAEIFLFLKNDLEIIKYFPYRESIAFGFQRLGAGIGACLSGIVGGKIYEYSQNNLNISYFWQIISYQIIFAIIIILVYFIKKSIK